MQVIFNFDFRNLFWLKKTYLKGDRSIEMKSGPSVPDAHL